MADSRPPRETELENTVRLTPGRRKRAPSEAQRRWLTRGADEPGGKLPLFDLQGRRVSKKVVEACISAGWAERWFNNPLKPDWLVCRLTAAGRAAVTPKTAVTGEERGQGRSKGRSQADDGDLLPDNLTGDLFPAE